MTKSKIYYAHSSNEYNKWHLLKEHLNSVSNKAKLYLTDWEAGEEEALISGLLHDLGKYGDRFQARLQGKDSGLDHWSQGAWLALNKPYCSIAAALSIQGHHIGLQYLEANKLRNLNPDSLKLQHPLNLQLSGSNPKKLLQRFAADNLQITPPAKTLLSKIEPRVDTMLDIRLLFSALVDADFLDTEAHFQGDINGKQYRKQGQPLDPEDALNILEKHLDAFPENKNKNVSVVRKKLRQTCADSAQKSQGLFTLTAPTGSGKTLAMLCFALAHAKVHNLRRVIVVTEVSQLLSS